MTWHAMIQYNTIQYDIGRKYLLSRGTGTCITGDLPVRDLSRRGDGIGVAVRVGV